MPENYPLVISRPPWKINQHDVLAWARSQRHNGEYPGGYVMAHNPLEVEPYVTWAVYTTDGGETWAACWGHYFMDQAEAWHDFTQRVKLPDQD